MVEIPIFSHASSSQSPFRQISVYGVDDTICVLDACVSLACDYMMKDGPRRISDAAQTHMGRRRLWRHRP